MQIKIFDDRTWFFNTGKLPEGIDLEQLKQPHPSIARNPLIVHVFYLAGFIEEYGSGIGRILEAAELHGLPEPEFKEEFGGFSVYFYKDIYSEEKLEKLGLSQRQIKAVMYVKENGKITNKELQNYLSITKKTSSRELAALVKKGILEQKGIAGRGVFYILASFKQDINGTNET